MDDGNTGVQRKLDDVSGAARPVTCSPVPDRDHDVGGGDDRLADLDIGSVTVRPLAREREELRGCIELAVEFLALPPLFEIVAVDVRREGQKRSHMEAVRLRAFGGELVGPCGERRVKPDDRARRVEQAFRVQMQAVDGFL